MHAYASSRATGLAVVAALTFLGLSGQAARGGEEPPKPAAAADPHAGHDMPAAPPADPHAAHEMSAMAAIAHPETEHRNPLARAATGADIGFGQQEGGAATPDRNQGAATPDYGSALIEAQPPEPSAPRLMAGASLDLRL